jgi:hypothetical protein
MATDNSPKGLRRSITALEGELHKLLRDAPWKNDKPSIGPQNYPKYDSHTAPGNPPLANDGADNAEQKPTRQTEKRRPWWIRRWAWKPWKRGIFAGAGMAGIFYAIITYGQWSDANNNFRVDQRAWLRIQPETEHLPGRDPAIEENFFTPLVGRPLTIPLRVANIGKTSAMDIEVSMIVEIVPMGQEPDLPTGDEDLTKPKPHQSVGHSGFHRITHQLIAERKIIFPGDYSQFIASRRNTEKDKTVDQVITEQEAVDLREAKSYLIVWGKIWYSDIFSRSHWHRFCLMPLANTQPNSFRCTEYSDIDR